MVEEIYGGNHTNNQPLSEWSFLIAAAEKDTPKAYPELVSSATCQLVVLACEVGGRWSDTCAWLVKEAARRKNEKAPARLRRATARASEARWWGTLSVAVQDTLASTLVDDALHLLHGWEGEGPPLGELLHGDAPAESRLPLR